MSESIGINGRLFKYDESHPKTFIKELSDLVTERENMINLIIHHTEANPLLVKKLYYNQINHSKDKRIKCEYWCEKLGPIGFLAAYHTQTRQAYDKVMKMFPED